MTMPEAAIDEDHCTVLWQHDVRLSRQFPIMEPIAEATGMNPAPDQHLRFGVSPPDRRHVAAAGLVVVNVSQLS